MASFRENARNRQARAAEAKQGKSPAKAGTSRSFSRATGKASPGKLTELKSSRSASSPKKASQSQSESVA
jgi:hypothetical protein